MNKPLPLQSARLDFIDFGKQDEKLSFIPTSEVNKFELHLKQYPRVPSDNYESLVKIALDAYRLLILHYITLTAMILLFLMT